MRDWFNRTYFFGAEGRMTALEGVRGLAFLLVFVLHFMGNYQAANYYLPPSSAWFMLVSMVRAGHVGVELFFILSALLIFGSATDTGRARFDPRRFAVKRAHRLFPLHLIAIIVLIIRLAVSNIAAAAAFCMLPLGYFVLSSRPAFLRWSKTIFLALFFLMPATLVTYVLLAPPGTAWTAAGPRQVLEMGLLEMSLASTFIDPDLNFNPSWSLSVELFFYFLVPSLLALYARLRSSYIAVAALLFCLCVGFSLAFPNSLLRGQRFMAFSFGIGLIPLVRSMDARPTLRRRIGQWGYLALPGLWACQWAFVARYQFAQNSQLLPFYIACDCAFALLVAGALSDTGPMHRLCTWRPLRFLGNISFSLYMTHSLVLAVSRVHMQQESFAGMFLDGILSLGLCVAVACFTFLFVEREYFVRGHAKEVEPR